MELSETVKQKQELVNKINLLDFAIRQLKTVEIKKDNEAKIEEVNSKILSASGHKFKLLEELLRLSGVSTEAKLELKK